MGTPSRLRCTPQPATKGFGRQGFASALGNLGNLGNLRNPESLRNRGTGSSEILKAETFPNSSSWRRRQPNAPAVRSVSISAGL